jgi:hypothetical protein
VQDADYATDDYVNSFGPRHDGHSCPHLLTVLSLSRWTISANLSHTCRAKYTDYFTGGVDLLLEDHRDAAHPGPLTILVIRGECPQYRPPFSACVLHEYGRGCRAQQPRWKPLVSTASLRRKVRERTSSRGNGLGETPWRQHPLCSGRAGGPPGFPAPRRNRTLRSK